MDSEVNEFVTTIDTAVSEKSLNAECNDVLLASDSVSTNGISNLSESGAVAYLEEANVNDIVQESLESGEEQEVLDKDDEIEELCEEEELDADVIAEQEEDDAIEYDDEEIEGEGENENENENENSSRQKECAQLPKKRKFAASSDTPGAVAGEVEEYDEEDEEEEELDDEIDAEEKAEAADLLADLHEDELPTSSRTSNKEETVDEDICRVCKTKENLVSLFKNMDTQTVADWLMLICPTVSIACKDFMPQYICQPCLDNVTIAVQLKTQCESTERELRKKLSRHKNKVRRPSGYVVIDAPVDSDPEEEDDEPASDAEFKVSDVEVSPSADETDTDDSDFSSKRKRSRGTGSKRGRRKATYSGSDKKNKSRGVKRSGGRSSEEEFLTEKRKRDPFDNSTAEFACGECDQVFTRKLSLVLHKKTHTQSEPIICNLCGKHFKIKGAYRTHMERHKVEVSTFTCTKCDFFFTSRSELKKHQMEEHNGGRDFGLTCRHCKRTFVSESRLQRHLENYCPSSEQAQKSRKSEYTEHSTAGKDLFKTVAPLTTTYWSDSFSD